jgi:hypothetical protein
MPDTPGVINYPTALDSALSLIEVNNNASTTLTANISASDLLIPVAQPGKFSNSGFATLVDSLTAPTKLEIFLYTSKSGSNLVVPTGGRGAQGTTAQSFSTGHFVEQRPTARHHTALVDLLLALENKLGIGSSTPGAGKALFSDVNGQSLWRALAQSDISGLVTALADKVSKSDTALQTIISDLKLSKDSPALTLVDTVGGLGSDFIINRNSNATNIGRSGQTDCLLDNTNGVYTFGQIPVLPGSDPTTANQAARKAYVDGRRYKTAFTWFVPDPSTVLLDTFAILPVILPDDPTLVLTSFRVTYFNGSHTAGGSVDFHLYVNGSATGRFISLNDTNNSPFAVYVDDIPDIPSVTSVTLQVKNRVGTITERAVSITVNGYHTPFN